MQCGRTTLLAVVGLFSLVGCTAADSAPGVGAEVGAVEVSVGPPPAPWVLDIVPTDAAVLRVAAAPTEETSIDPLAGAGTLYGHPDAADLLDGPLLLVGSSGDSGGGGPDRSATGAHPVDLDLGYGGAAFVPAGDRSWVTVPSGQDGVAYVVGQGIAEADLVAAARGMDQLGAPPTVPRDALPTGMQPLVAGPSGDGPSSSRGERVVMESGGVRLDIFVVHADQRLATLWGFWIADPTPSADQLMVAEGVTGFRAGPMPDTSFGAEAYGVVWAVDGDVVSVVGAALSSDIGLDDMSAGVEGVAAQLRVGTSAELAALGRRVCDTRRFSPNCRDWTSAG